MPQLIVPARKAIQLGTTITKLDAARRQLLAAINLHWYLDEPIAAYTLAANAWELCNSLLKRDNKTRLLAEFSRVHGRPETDFKALINRPRNFVKHADKDPDGNLEDVTNQDVDGMLQAACIDYTMLARRSPLAVQLFLCWYSAIYSDKTGAFLKEGADAYFPNLIVEDREARVLAARKAFGDLAKDGQLMQNVKTELTDHHRWVKLGKWAES